MTIAICLNAHAQLDKKKIHSFEDSLNDVTEIIDKELVKKKLIEVESEYRSRESELTSTRLGLIYHEVALNLTFFDKTEKYNGYAQKSYDILTKLMNNEETSPELLIFIETYRASALSLVAAETRKLKLIGTSFELFEKSIAKYASVSPIPEFMRGSVAENLPFFMWKKRKFAKVDFESIIDKQELDSSYADFRIMSFTYWGWARAHKRKKYRKVAIHYLQEAIKLDPEYEAGRKRAEELMEEYSR